MSRLKNYLEADEPKTSKGIQLKISFSDTEDAQKFVETYENSISANISGRVVIFTVKQAKVLREILDDLDEVYGVLK